MISLNSSKVYKKDKRTTSTDVTLLLTLLHLVKYQAHVFAWWA